MSKHSARQLTPARLVLGFAATILVALVGWVAIRAGGPANADDAPVIVQPTPPALQAVEGSLPSASAPSSSLPPTVESAVVSVSPSASASTAASASASASASRKPKKSKSPKPAVTSPAATPTRTTPPPPADDLEATYNTGASWRDGFIGNVRIVNTGSVPHDFTVTISFPAGTDVSLRGAWNASGSAGGNTVTLRGGPIAPGATVNAGFQASKDGRDSSRANGCTVGGGSCRVS